MQRRLPVEVDQIDVAAPFDQRVQHFPAGAPVQRRPAVLHVLREQLVRITHQKVRDIA